MHGILSYTDPPEPMQYIDYIELGFKRYDTNDSVHFNATGNDSFALIYKLNKNLSIEVSIETNTITLYYKGNTMCELTVEQMKQIINRKHNLR
jgi:hypothetical protein